MNMFLLSKLFRGYYSYFWIISLTGHITDNVKDHVEQNIKPQQQCDKYNESDSDDPVCFWVRLICIG